MTIVVGAPLRGWASALDEVPDPVFAERMMGDGLAIDPLDGEVRAPCAGHIVSVAPTRHSITIEVDGGAQLLIHIGIETVGLAGDGFVAHVEAGAGVAAGDLLLSFDIDWVATRAKSLVTPIVLASAGHELAPVSVDRLVEQGDPLFELRPLADRSETVDPGHDTTRCEVVIPFAHGLHARPAARLTAALKPFAAQVSLTADGREANARSVVALLSLGLKQGARVTVTGRGMDSRPAVAALLAVIENPSRDEGEKPAVASTAPATEGGGLRGVCAVPGLASGPVAHLKTLDPVVVEQGEGTSRETDALDRAIAVVRARLSSARSGPAAHISEAHRALLDDPELLDHARRAIANGKSAAFAWRSATQASCAALRATGDRLLIERTADLTDVERQVIAELAGLAAPVTIAAGAILIADELLPSQFLALGETRPAGIATARGGPTSHVAILAAASGLPMLVAAGDALLAVPEGQTVLLDATAATLNAQPTREEVNAFAARVAAARKRRAEEAAAATVPSMTADGVRIELFANLGSLEDARIAIAAGAEGCGLLRTEFLFLDRDEAPDEDEQRAAYAAIAHALDGRPLIVRTLDIGGDKPVPYLPIDREENPALGLRGVRLSLARPATLATQLRAILRGVPDKQCRIMVPMIVDLAELRQVRALLEEAAAAVGCETPPLGVMVETPAAALLADQLAREADFLSIGSNDLTQYVLATDRGNTALAARVDALHPAVLRLIALTGEAAAQHGKWLGVCGGVASDPAAAAILIGLGATELSSTPAAVAAVKAAVRGLRVDECRSLAREALAQASAAEVRALLGEA